MNRPLAAALALAICASVARAQTITIKQDSVPEAIIPTTDKLAFPGPVTDNGVTLQLFRQQGEGVEFSPDGRWIAYDCKHADGYYNIHVCHPDGTSDRCLTTLDNGLPHRHAGSATWSAGGKYLVFTAEKTVHHGGSIEAIPGFGGRSDLWAMRADGSKAWPLTDLPDDRNFGVIIPKFSRDGTRLAWAQRVSYPRFFDHRDAFGDWVVKVADFVDGPGGPRLDHIRTLAPGGTAFYEAYGFSPDGRQIIFCSDFEGTGAFHSQIYVMDAADGSHLRRLTRGNAYNEHASYSPDGRHIVWMTNLDNSSGGCDWWIMDADGSNPRRLTHLNQTGYPDSTHAPVWACLTSWAPDGTQLLGGIQYSLFKQEGRIFLMTLEPALLAK